MVESNTNKPSPPPPIMLYRKGEPPPVLEADTVYKLCPTLSLPKSLSETPGSGKTPSVTVTTTTAYEGAETGRVFRAETVREYVEIRFPLSSRAMRREPLGERKKSLSEG